MKNFKLLVVLLLFFQSMLQGQKGSSHHEEARPEVYFDFHASTIDLCDETKHVYLEFYTDSYYGADENVESPIKKMKVYPTNEPQKRQILKEGKDVEFFNLRPNKNEIPFTIVAFNDKNEKLFQSEITVNTVKEKGVVDVTERLDGYLDKFVGSNSSLFTYFCGKTVSKVELLAFFQDFLELSPVEMCAMIDKYELYTNSSFSNWMEGKWVWQLCNLLEEYQNSLISGGDDDPAEESDCVCNLIRTKSSALNVGTGSANTNPTEDCEFYTPKLTGKNYDPDGADGDDDLILSTGRFGAAKAGTVELFYDGSDDSPDWEAGMKQGWSTLRYRSVCVDPNTIDPDISNCATCQKKVNIEYGYYSSVDLFAQRLSCFACPEKAEVTIEDWAMLVVQNGDEVTVVDSDAKRFQAICGFDPNDPTIDSLLTNLPDLIQAIGLAIAKPNAETVIAASAELIEFMENSILETSCATHLVDEYTSFAGDTTFLLNPGEQLKVTLVSNAKFGGKIVNHGRAIGSINSDFYLTGVLTTIPDSAGGVPEYCECEKIASYAVGSLEPFTPSSDFIVDEPSNGQVNWSEIFLNSPFNLATMQQLVGSFVGTAGDWGDAFELAGCCDVVIPCHSDCVFLTGCGDDLRPDRASNSSKTLVIEQEDNESTEHLTKSPNDNITTTLDEIMTRSIVKNTKLKIVSDVKVFPNPVSDTKYLSVVLEPQFQITKLNVFDINGSLVNVKTNLEKNTAKIDVDHLSDGMYVLVFEDQKSKIYLHKFIKL